MDRTVYITSNAYCTCEWGSPTDWRLLSQWKCNCSCGTRSVLQFTTPNKVPQCTSLKSIGSTSMSSTTLVHITSRPRSDLLTPCATWWCRVYRKLEISTHVLYCIFDIRRTIIVTAKTFRISTPTVKTKIFITNDLILLGYDFTFEGGSSFLSLHSGSTI